MKKDTPKKKSPRENFITKQLEKIATEGVIKKAKPKQDFKGIIKDTYA